MNSLARRVDGLGLLLLGLIRCGSLTAQPLCDVLLRPAFNYTTDGLFLVVTDSSTTYGIEASPTWSHGDSPELSEVGNHSYSSPGTYTVCMTLTATEIGCSSTYCREVIVPLIPCGSSAAAAFSWERAGLNTAAISDVSLVSIPSEARRWEFGDGDTSDVLAPVHTWSLPGPHFVTLTRTQANCTSTTGQWVEVDGNAGSCGPDLFADFAATATEQVVTFQPSIAVNNVVPFVAIWSYGDGEVDTTAIGDHLYASAGTYQTCLLVGAMEALNEDTCFSLVCHTSEVLPTVGLIDPSASPFAVWPNPFSSYLNIAMPNHAMPATATLYDATGRIVLQRRDMGIEVGFSNVDLKEGPYVLEVSQGRSTHRTLVVRLRE